MKTKGLNLIAKEQKRVRQEVGHTAEADLGLVNQELSRAGAIYALPMEDRVAMHLMLNAEGESLLQAIYPFKFETYKPLPEDRVKELSKAGAFIASEIDRLLSEGSVEGVAETVKFISQDEYDKMTDLEQWEYLANFERKDLVTVKLDNDDTYFLLDYDESSDQDPEDRQYLSPRDYIGSGYGTEMLLQAMGFKAEGV